MTPEMFGKIDNPKISISLMIGDLAKSDKTREEWQMCLDGLIEYDYDLGAFITVPAFQRLVEVIISSKTLKKVGLTRIPLDFSRAVGVRVFADVLKNNSITSLSLAHSCIGGIGNGDVIALAEAIKIHGSLSRLNLSCNSIEGTDAIALVEVMGINNTITDLILYDNLLGPAGAIALAKALKVNNSITNLDLGRNSIKDTGAIAIAEAIKTNNAVTKLSLYQNSIGEIGAIELAEAIMVNKVIIFFNLHDNSIRDVGARAMADALMINKTVTNLDLGQNFIEDIGTLAVADAMRINNAITVLILSWNRMGDAGAAALAEMLKVNITLTTLDFVNNLIQDGGEIAFVEAMNCNSVVTNLRGVRLNKYLPLLSLPEEFSTKDNQKILTFLRQRKHSVHPMTMYRMRVMIVGPGEAGKTTLVHRILTDEYRYSHSRTDGVSMNEWNPLIKDEEDLVTNSSDQLSNYRMSISLWDFGGQDVYLNSHPILFSDRILYLLVWNPLHHPKYCVPLEEYVVNIRSRSKTAPIVLVTTHSSDITVAEDDKCLLAMKDKCSVLYDPVLNSQGISVKMFPLNLGTVGNTEKCLKEISSSWREVDAGLYVEWKHFPLDSKTGDGVNELKECVIRFLQACSPRVLLPGWYNGLELKLRELSLTIFSINREEFHHICCSCWSDTPPDSDAEVQDRIKTVLDLFHHWGVIYLLPDPSCPSFDLCEGNGDIVLNPQNLANVFRAVITCTTRPSLECGVLYHDQADDIWPEYDSRLHHQFLTLFHDCELAYEIGDSEGNPSGKSLIPSILPEPPTLFSQVEEIDLRERIFGVWERKSDTSFKEKRGMISQGYVKITVDCLLPNFFPKLLVRLRHMSSSSPTDCSRHHCVVRLAELELESGRSVGWSLCCVVVDRESRSLLLYPGGCSYDATTITHEAIHGLLEDSFAGMVLIDLCINVNGDSYTLDELRTSSIFHGLLASLRAFERISPLNTCSHTSLSLNCPFSDRREVSVLCYYFDLSNSVLTNSDRIQLYKSLLSSIDIFRNAGLGLNEDPAILWLVGKTSTRYCLYAVSPSLSPIEPWTIAWHSKCYLNDNEVTVEQSQLSKLFFRLVSYMFAHDTIPFAKDDMEWIGIPRLSREVADNVSGTVPKGFKMIQNFCGQTIYHHTQKFKGLDEAMYQIASANEHNLYLHLSDKLLTIDIPKFKALLMRCQRKIGEDYWHTFVSVKQMIGEDNALSRVALLQLSMLRDARIEDHWKRKVLFGLLISQGLTIVREANVIVAPIHESNLENALTKLDFQYGPGFESIVQFLSKDQQSHHRLMKPPDLIFLCKELSTTEGLLISDLVKHILRGLANSNEHLSSLFRLKSVSSVMNKLFYRGKDIGDLFAASAKNMHEYGALINLVKSCGGIFFEHSTNGNGSEVLKYYRVLQVNISAIKRDGRSYNPFLFPVFYEIVLLTSYDRAPHEFYELKRLKCTLFEKFESSSEVQDHLTRRNISFEHPAMPGDEMFSEEGS